MTIQSQAITIAKQLLGITDASQDEFLLALGGIAETDAVAISKNEAILLEGNILGRMIQYLYNQRGQEGLASQSVATVSETYTSGTSAYPEQLSQALRGFTKLKTL